MSKRKPSKPSALRTPHGDNLDFAYLSINSIIKFKLKY